MTSTPVRWLRHTANVGLLLAFSTLAAAAATEYEKHADGLAVYMGVLAAQVLRGNADASHLATMMVTCRQAAAYLGSIVKDT